MEKSVYDRILLVFKYLQLVQVLLVPFCFKPRNPTCKAQVWKLPLPKNSTFFIKVSIKTVNPLYYDYEKKCSILSAAKKIVFYDKNWLLGTEKYICEKGKKRLRSQWQNKIQKIIIAFYYYRILHSEYSILIFKCPRDQYISLVWSVVRLISSKQRWACMTTIVGVS